MKLNSFKNDIKTLASLLFVEILMKRLRINK